MQKKAKSAIIGALCAATAVTAMPPEALAGPTSAAPPSTVSLTAPVDTVHYRRYRHYRRYGYDPAGAIFAGAALGLIGAGVAAAARPRYYYGGWGYPYYGYGWGYPVGYGGYWW